MQRYKLPRCTLRKVYDYYVDKPKNNDDGDKVTLLYGVWLKHIRISYDCESRIVKSVLRITVWHHEACRVMANGDPEGRVF